MERKEIVLEDQKASLLSSLKELLGISKEENSLDTKLAWILDSARMRLKLLLGGLDPPEDMEYMIVEAAVVRFNRIGSEGLSAHSVEGESLSFSDHDFAGFMGEIEAYLDEQKGVRKGRVRFL